MMRTEILIGFVSHLHAKGNISNIIPESRKRLSSYMEIIKTTLDCQKTLKTAIVNE